MTQFQGTFTALVTPFRDDRVDVRALQALAEWQVAEGIHGLVVCGSTGEAANLSLEERLAAVAAVQDVVRGRVPVIAGAGTHNTRTTLDMILAMKGLRVDGVLVVTPYYVKPTPVGMIEHYRAAAALGVPVVAYNVPGRTGVSLTADTLGLLSRIPGVVALKEASADLKLDASMIRAAGGRLSLLSGDDFTYLPFLSVGGQGCISVMSNLAPREMGDLYRAWTTGDVDQARAIQLKLLPAMEALFLESNPIPVKAALAMLGRISWEIRLPLTPLSEGARPKLEGALREAGLWNPA
jgi:4-hydroxy-tetrahydrodipicolinate synthase